MYAYHMDEYIGLAPDAPQGFGNFLRRSLFEKVPFAGVEYLNGGADDIDAEIRRYSQILRKHPADMVFMGIGENGHIAFNDPHVAHFDDCALVKKVELDERCRAQQVHDGCFDAIDQVPTHALTLTIPALVRAERIFCMVPAATKAEAVEHTCWAKSAKWYPPVFCGCMSMRRYMLTPTAAAGCKCGRDNNAAAAHNGRRAGGVRDQQPARGGAVHAFLPLAVGGGRENDY